MSSASLYLRWKQCREMYRMAVYREIYKMKMRVSEFFKKAKIVIPVMLISPGLYENGYLIYLRCCWNLHWSLYTKFPNNSGSVLMYLEFTKVISLKKNTSWHLWVLSHTWVKIKSAAAWLQENFYMTLSNTWLKMKECAGQQKAKECGKQWGDETG